MIGLTKLKQVDKDLYERLHEDRLFVDFFKGLYILLNMSELLDVEKIALFILDHFNSAQTNEKCMQCVICLNTIVNPIKSVSCTHIYCNKCYMEWLRSYSTTCPTCRTNPFEHNPNFCDINKN